MNDAIAALDDPAFYANDPYPSYARLRAEDPVHRFEGEEGTFWALSRHADVLEVSKHPERFCSGKGVLLTDLTRPVLSTDSIIYLDPPRHQKHRKLLSPSLTVRRIGDLEPRIRALANELLDGLDTSAPIEVVDALAAPFPLLVIGELLGVPRSDFAMFRRWSDAIIQAASDYTDESLALAGEFFLYIAEIVSDRRITPRDDLISVLINGRVDGEALSEEDVNMFCMSLLVAGNETTRTLIANAMVALVEHPEQRSLLASDASLLPTAVEELLRWEAPIMSFCRTATSDVEIGGRGIREGEYVVMLYSAANRDEAAFGPTADRLDVKRDPNPHLSFGYAEHYCMGAGLARMETRIVFEELLRRWPAYELAGSVERLESRFVRGIGSLPIAFEP
ncbi:MAG: cytochrome P450 [Acidimicrobiales bacterium]